MECPNCGKPMKTKKEKLTNDYIKELNDKELTIYFCDCCDETFFDVDEFDALLDEYRSSLHKDEEEIPHEKILETRTKYGLTQEEMSFILNKKGEELLWEQKNLRTGIIGKQVRTSQKKKEKIWLKMPY